MNYLPKIINEEIFEVYHFRHIANLWFDSVSGKIIFKVYKKKETTSIDDLRKFNAQYENMTNDNIISDVIKRWDSINSGK